MAERILIVDDERTICIAIQRLLTGRGYDVDTALSGEEAIEKLGGRPYHLVITDLNLKSVSGMDLLRWVKQHAPETAVIMITAYGSEKIAVEAMKLGAADYLPKPFDNDELELMVERVFEGMTLRRDLRAPPGAGGGRVPLREHHRQERRHAARLRRHPEGRRHRPDGARSAARAAPARSWSPTPSTTTARGARKPLDQGELRRLLARARRERALRPREGRVHRRDQRPARASSRSPTAARSSSTRSATWRSRRRRSSCASCRRRSSSGSAATARSRSTCASSPRPTRTSRRR